MRHRPCRPSTPAAQRPFGHSAGNELSFLLAGRCGSPAEFGIGTRQRRTETSVQHAAAACCLQGIFTPPGDPVLRRSALGSRRNRNEPRVTETRTIAAIIAAQVLVQIGAFALPALLPHYIAAWSLSATEAGWLIGGFFAAYVAAVPVLVALTDRVPARRIYLL